MKSTTPDAALEKLAEWRDGRAWVDCRVSSRDTTIGYRGVGLIADFDDGFVVGSSLDRCAASLPAVLFRHSDLIEIDTAGGLHLRFPHADIWISEIAREVGHA